MRPILAIDREAYEEALNADARNNAMQQAKQVGIAVLIYATENEDVLPGPATFAEDVKRYLRNERLLENFVYTFVGGPATELQNPAATELGFIAVAGGRVVVYADSTVKFVPQ